MSFIAHYDGITDMLQVAVLLSVRVTYCNGAIRVIWGPQGLLHASFFGKVFRARNGETFATLPVSHYQYISSPYSFGNFSDINEVQFAIFGTVVRFVSTFKTCRIGGGSGIRIKQKGFKYRVFNVKVDLF